MVEVIFMIFFNYVPPMVDIMQVLENGSTDTYVFCAPETL